MEYLYELIDQSIIELEENGWRDFWKAQMSCLKIKNLPFWLEAHS